MVWFNSWAMDLIVLTAAFWVALYIYFQRNCNHWKIKKVPYFSPLPFVGNILPVLILQKSIGALLREFYEKTKKPFVGFFISDQPCLLIRDPNLIKQILIKDFEVWYDRNGADNHKNDPIGSYILFFLKNKDGWRNIRKKSTAMFSSGRMKMIYQLFQKINQEMLTYVENKTKQNIILNIKDVSAKYTTDSITSTTFGIDAHSFQNENADFRLVSQRVLNFDFLERCFSTSCYFISPFLVKLLKLKFVDKESCHFLKNAFLNTMKQREKSEFNRHDLVDILLELKNKFYTDESDANNAENILVAQAVQFFLAGFETTSSLISFTAYELAANPTIQNTLRKEVQKVKKKHGSLTYDALQEMTYLNMCINESMRKYPPLPFLDRKSNKDYQIPGTDITLDKGISVFVASWGLHMDPEYFPDPERFDPTRFTKENIDARPPFTYLSFGDGPRSCIGAKFGLLNSKSFIANLISRFEVEICPETGYPIKCTTKGFLLQPQSDLWLKIKPLPNTSI